MICENYSPVVASSQCVVGIDHESLVVALFTTRFNIKKLYVLCIECMYVFCMVLRTNNNYFYIQHWLTAFYNVTVCFRYGNELNLSILFWSFLVFKGLNYHSECNVFYLLFMFIFI